MRLCHAPRRHRSLHCRNGRGPRVVRRRPSSSRSSRGLGKRQHLQDGGLQLRRPQAAGPPGPEGGAGARGGPDGQLGGQLTPRKVGIRAKGATLRLHGRTHRCGQVGDGGAGGLAVVDGVLGKVRNAAHKADEALAGPAQHLGRVVCPGMLVLLFLKLRGSSWVGVAVPRAVGVLQRRGGRGCSGRRCCGCTGCTIWRGCMYPETAGRGMGDDGRRRRRRGRGRYGRSARARGAPSRRLHRRGAGRRGRDGRSCSGSHHDTSRWRRRRVTGNSRAATRVSIDSRRWRRRRRHRSGGQGARHDGPPDGRRAHWRGH
jgi:hypothetical protein